MSGVSHVNIDPQITSRFFLKKEEESNQARATKSTMKQLPSLTDSIHTEATRDHAKAALKKFIESHYDRVHSFADAEVEDGTQELVGQFATFLYDDPATGYSASPTYLSSAKRQLEDKTRIDFFERNKTWCTRLRQHLRNKYGAAANLEGKSLEDKAPPMSMEDLRVIGRISFLRNDVRSLKDRLISGQWRDEVRTLGILNLTTCIGWGAASWFESHGGKPTSSPQYRYSLPSCSGR